MKKIAIYGATGSVGQQALEVVRSCPDRLAIELMSCHTNVAELVRAANEFRPSILVISCESIDLGETLKKLHYTPRILQGTNALAESLKVLRVDLILNAVAGLAGLPLLAAALAEGVATALANKESIVAGGDVIKSLWLKTGTRIYPVDSEHAAIYQCLGNTFDSSNAATIWLAASGGPFLTASSVEIKEASVDQALRHPTWRMSPKISVDSATLANKGLEIIEAHFLFDMPGDAIKVVIQPASLVHSMVEFKDTSVLAQLGQPDMRVPIERALLGPDADVSLPAALNFWEVGAIEFLKPDFARFPCLRLAYEALNKQLGAVYNAANCAAVELFLNGKIRFSSIPNLISSALASSKYTPPKTIAEILALDEEVQQSVRRLASKEAM